VSATEITGVAASSLLAPLIDGQPVTGEVVLSSARAAYLRVEAEVLALLAPGATALPCAVLLPPGLVPPAAGTRIRVGGGRLAWFAHTCSVTRWWLPARVRAGRLDPGAVDGFARLRAGQPGAVQSADRSLLADAVGSMVRGEVEDAASSAAALIGHGPGATPAADDALAGVLLTLRAAGACPEESYARLERLLRPARGRTTLLSAALLGHALAGWAAGPVVRAVASLQSGSDPAALSPAVRGLLALGHSSGADSATGIVLGARLVLALAAVDARGEVA
jgi:hypothetical protein